MKTVIRRWPSAAIVLVPILALAAGCVAGGYADDGSYDAGYYEPDGYDYGYWGSGYEVGPYGRGGGRHDDHGGGRQRSHAYRPAPASHQAPSIPHGSRSGGGHSRSH